jgi:hypothetical protein
MKVTESEPCYGLTPFRATVMSIFPITPLVRRVQALVLETFDVSEQEAEDYAAELVALAEGWGSPETAPELDWPYIIRKRLGETRKLRWRSEAERLSFEATRKQTFEAYEAFTRSRHT